MKRIFAALLFCLLAASPGHAALGDVKAACVSTANDAFVDVQPGAGEGWTIHLITFAGNVELQLYNGTDSSIFATLIGPDFQNFDPALHSDNTTRLRIKNVAGSTQVICYSGAQTK